MISKKYVGLVQSLIISIAMSFFMSLVMTIVNIGISNILFFAWMRAFGIGTLVAIPTGIIVGPLAHRLASRMVEN